MASETRFRNFMGLLILILIIIILLLVSWLLFLHFSTRSVSAIAGRYSQASMNTSVDPCDNFYEFACQRWMEKVSSNYYSKRELEEPITRHVINVLAILKEPINPTEFPALSTAKRYFSECIKSNETIENCFNLTLNGFYVVLGHAYVKKVVEPSFGAKWNQIWEKLSKVENLFSDVRNWVSEIVISMDDRNIMFQHFIWVVTTKMCPPYPSWIIEEDQVQSEYSELNLNATFQVSASFSEQSAVVEAWSRDKLKNKWGTCDYNPRMETLGAYSATDEIIGMGQVQRTGNRVFIGLGLLKFPFYNEILPRFWNYAKLGTTIGHELAHTLTDSGWSTFANGTRKPLAECLVQQYSDFRLDKEGNSKVDGVHTFEENLVDTIGLIAAFKAYKNNSLAEQSPKLVGLEEYSSDQLFFLEYAQNFCGSEEQQLKYAESDKHSPDQFRVLGTLQNSEDFARAWNCPIGSKMNPGGGRESCRVI